MCRRFQRGIYGIVHMAAYQTEIMHSLEILIWSVKLESHRGGGLHTGALTPFQVIQMVFNGSKLDLVVVFSLTRSC